MKQIFHVEVEGDAEIARLNAVIEVRTKRNDELNTVITRILFDYVGDL